jgi:hypothetical protein
MTTSFSAYECRYRFSGRVAKASTCSSSGRESSADQPSKCVVNALLTNTACRPDSGCRITTGWTID